MLRPLIVLFILALPAVAADEPKLPGPKINWPEVKGFTRGKTTTFPRVELGYSVAYSAPGLLVTVYVYDKGLKEIPGGAKSDLVKAEMKQMVADIEEAKKRGFYTSVKEVGEEEVVSLGKAKDAPQARKRKFEIERPKEGETFSEAYITGYKDHFIKLRVTYQKDGAEKNEQLLKTFLEALGAELK